MCTVTFIPREDGFYVAMNRDERHARPYARPPAVFEEGFARSIYPIDCEGGTWIACNHMGIAFTLVNWNDAPLLRKKSRTRGHVIPALVNSDCSQSAESALGTFDIKGVLPFRLVGIFPREGRLIEWRWNQRSIELHSLSWAARQWCSSSLSDATAASARMQVFEQKLRVYQTGSPAWLRQLHSSHDDRYPRFSHCVHREEVETVSYTELVCSTRGIHCNYLAGSPCKTDLMQHKTSIRLARTLASSALPANRTERSFVSPRT